MEMGRHVRRGAGLPAFPGPSDLARERDLSPMNGFSVTMRNTCGNGVLDGGSMRTRHCIRDPVVGFGRISLPRA